MMVVLFHCNGLIAWPANDRPFAFAETAWVGVDIFFAISGFVIGKSAMAHCRTPDYALTFWRSRAARILPLYFVTLAVFLVAIQPKEVLDRPLLHIGLHAVFLHNVFAETMFSVNGVTWSLAIEAQFYLLAFLLAPRIATMPANRAWTVFALVCAGVIAFRAAVYFLLSTAGPNPDAISHQLSQVPALFEGFMFGMVAATLRPSPGSIPKWLPSLAGATVLACYLILHWGFVPNRETYWTNPIIAIFFRSGVAAFASLCVLTALLSTPADPLAFRLMKFLGKISYGIYLWHLILLFSLGKTGLSGSPWLVALGTVFGSVLIATVSYQLIEYPFIAWDKNQRSRKAEGKSPST